MQVSETMCAANSTNLVLFKPFVVEENYPFYRWGN